LYAKIVDGRLWLQQREVMSIWIVSWFISNVLIARKSSLAVMIWELLSRNQKPAQNAGVPIPFIGNLLMVAKNVVVNLKIKVFFVWKINQNKYGTIRKNNCRARGKEWDIIKDRQPMDDAGVCD
jgi:hypothetical protein